jgi:hypothetical protein
MLRVAILLTTALVLTAVSRPPDIRFNRHELDVGANETCALADINGDGRLDRAAKTGSRRRTG